MTGTHDTEAIRRFQEKVTVETGLVMKHVAFNLWNRITEKNPVATGRSRAAWNLAINHVDASVPVPVKKGTTLPKPTLPACGEIRPGDKIFVSNNLPYIVALENGHSQQAPQGMVQQSINEVVTYYDGIVKQVAYEA